MAKTRCSLATGKQVIVAILIVFGLFISVCCRNKLPIGIIAIRSDDVDYTVELAIQDVPTKWSKPIHNWKAVMNRFIIEFEDHLKDHI